MNQTSVILFDKKKLGKKTVKKKFASFKKTFVCVYVCVYVCVRVCMSVCVRENKNKIKLIWLTIRKASSKMTKPKSLHVTRWREYGQI